MYLSGVNATANRLSPAVNYVIWSARLGSPGYTEYNPAEWSEIKSHYVMIETLAHKSIYDHLTRMATVDEIINMNVSKVSWRAKKLTLTQLQRECIT